MSKVTRAVRTIDEAARIDVQLAAKTVLIESDADVDDLIAAISDAGYSAQAISDDADDEGGAISSS